MTNQNDETAYGDELETDIVVTSGHHPNSGDTIAMMEFLKAKEEADKDNEEKREYTVFVQRKKVITQYAKIKVMAVDKKEAQQIGFTGNEHTNPDDYSWTDLETAIIYINPDEK